MSWRCRDRSAGDQEEPEEQDQQLSSYGDMQQQQQQQQRQQQQQQPYNENQFATFWPPLFPPFFSPFPMNWDFSNYGSGPYFFNNTQMMPGYDGSGQSVPTNFPNSETASEREVQEPQQRSTTGPQAMAPRSSVPNVRSSEAPSDRPSVGLSPAAEVFRPSKDTNSSRVQSMSSRNTTPPSAAQPKLSSPTEKRTGDLSELKQKAKESLSRRKILKESQMEENKALDLERPESARGAIRQIKEITDALREKIEEKETVQSRENREAEIARQSTAVEFTSGVPSTPSTKRSPCDAHRRIDGATDTGRQREGSVGFDSVARDLHELIAQGKSAAQTGTSNREIETGDEVERPRPTQRLSDDISPLTRRVSRPTAAELNSPSRSEVHHNKSYTSSPTGPGFEHSTNPSNSSDDQSLIGRDEREYTKEVNSPSRDRRTRERTQNQLQLPEHAAATRARTNGNRASDLDASTQIQRDLAFATSELADRSNRRTQELQTTNNDEEELHEWLILSGFHDLEFRRKKLAVHRRLNEIEKEKRDLLREADADTCENVFLVPSTIASTGKKIKGGPPETPSTLVARPSPSKVKDEATNQPQAHEVTSNKKDLKRSKEVTKSSEDIANRPNKVAKLSDAPDQPAKGARAKMRVPTSPSSGPSRRSGRSDPRGKFGRYDSYQPRNDTAINAPLAIDRRRENDNRRGYEPQRDYAMADWEPLGGRGQGYYGPGPDSRSHSDPYDRFPRGPRGGLFDRGGRRP